MSSLENALRRLNVAIDQLDGRVSKLPAASGGDIAQGEAISALETERDALKGKVERGEAERRHLTNEAAALRDKLASAKAEGEGWKTRATAASREVDAAIKEIQDVLRA
ncbi:MAG: hypothetical protein AAF527_11810 [Pseudomonadota bacterium]